jgi:pimeloyl-ACP methyl ester carboxylesterase
VIVRVLEYVAEGAGGAFFIGSVLYVVISYAVALRHHGEVPLGVVVREAARELLVALVIQPLLPLFFFLGRRMGGRKKGTPIVLVHGYLQNRVDFVYVARVLRKRGLGPMYALNYWTLDRIEPTARKLEAFIVAVCKETGEAKVDLLCHSLGGIVAGEYVRRTKDRVRRCVTMATPHEGVAWPGPIVGRTARIMRRGSRYMRETTIVPFGVPVLSIYSALDNIVYPKQTSVLAQRGGSDHEVRHVGHLAILFDRGAAEAAADFLRDDDPQAA